MTPLVRISSLGPEHLDLILKLQSCSPEAAAWSAPTWASLLRLDRVGELWQRHVFGAFADAQSLVGVVAVNLVDANTELELLLVSPGWRRRGVGRALSERWMQWACLHASREHGVEAFLEVRLSNAAAQGLYQRLGFAEVARRAQYYREPNEDAIVMRKQLVPALVRGKAL